MAVNVNQQTAQSGADGKLDFESYCREVFSPAAAFTKPEALKG